jgi:hypothetical protein
VNSAGRNVRLHLAPGEPLNSLRTLVPISGSLFWPAEPRGRTPFSWTGRVGRRRPRGGTLLRKVGHIGRLRMPITAILANRPCERLKAGGTACFPGALQPQRRVECPQPPAPNPSPIRQQDPGTFWRWGLLLWIGCGAPPASFVSAAGGSALCTRTPREECLADRRKSGISQTVAFMRRREKRVFSFNP